jgi:hypothetical protein
VESILTAILAIAIGAILCFYGLGFIRVSIMLAGFVLGYLLSQNAGATLLVSLLVGGVGVIVALILVRFARNIAERILSFLMGGLVGLQIANYVNAREIGGVALVLIIVVIASIIATVLINFLGNRALIWSTALGGATIIVYGIGLLLPPLNFLARPTNAVESVFSVALIFGLFLFGTLTQLRLFRRVVTRTVIRAR